MGSSFSVSTLFKGVDKMSPIFNKMGKSAMGFGGIIKGILGAKIIQFGFQKLKQGVMSFFNEAVKIEDATAAFTPLMGSVDKANALVMRLNKEAATTPYQFEGISDVAKQLLPVMNQDINRTAETFRMLGDTAGGKIEKLDSITRGYVKALLKGKPDMEALNMIAEAGVPIFSEMSKSIGVSQAALFEMSKKGQLTNDMLTKTFQNMTSEGGIFYKGMEIASQTASGLMSTLKDNIALTAAAIGGTFMDNIKDGIKFLISITGKIQDWVIANKDLIKSKIDTFLSKAASIFKTIYPIISSVIKAVSSVIGKLLKPITIIGKKIFELGKVIFDILIGSFKNLINPIGGAGGSLKILSGIFDFASGFISAFTDGIKFLSPALKILIPAFVALSAVMIVVNAIMSANPISLIIIGIAALIAGIGLLVKYWNVIVKAFQDAWAAVVRFYDTFKGLILIFAPVLTPIMMLVEVIRSLIKNWNEITSAFKNKGFIAGITEIGKAIWEGLVSPFKSLIDIIGKAGSAVGGFFQGVGNFFGGVGKGIGDFFTGKKEKESPNQVDAQTRQRAQWEGSLNINGAPAGSTFDQKSKGAPPLKYALLGPNK